MMKAGIYTRTNKVIIDAGIFSTSFLIAYLIRFEGFPPRTALKQFLLWFPYLVAARVYINWKFGIYRSIWRYVSLPDAISMGRTMSALSFFLLALRFLYPISDSILVLAEGSAQRDCSGIFPVGCRLPGCSSSPPPSSPG